ncbi:MAG: LysR family transcriptional regulator [Clostridia bacterium]|nr:LysR family transcriptional regulator [Clostridia bacterium]
METSRIRGLLLAAKYQSLSRAAEEFSYTPSALSHIADALEEELGVKLLSRTRAGVSLTEEGTLLKEKMEAVLRAEEELRAAAAALGEKNSSILRIAAYSSISTYLLPQIVKRFKKENPDVRVSISVVDSLRGWLENDAVDVVFGDLSAIGENEHVVIMEDPYVAVLPEETLAGRRSVRREDLYPFPYISTNEGVLHRYFDEDRFAEILFVDSADDAAVLSLVKEGIGVAVLTSLATRKHVKGVRTVALSPKISRSIGLAYRMKNPATERFLTFMKGYKANKKA